MVIPCRQGALNIQIVDGHTRHTHTNPHICDWQTVEGGVTIMVTPTMQHHLYILPHLGDHMLNTCQKGVCVPTFRGKVSSKIPTVVEWL